MAEAGKWQMVAWAVAAALVVFAGARMLDDRGADAGAPLVRVDRGAGAGDRGEATGSGAPARGRAGIYVHVAGAVRRPGLLRMDAGTRVAVAIERAGGATRAADLTAVNLAAPLEDGQQVVVPRAVAGGGGLPRGGGGEGLVGGGGGGRAGAPGAGLAGGSGAAAGAAALSLATATTEQLEQLDGIGPTIARRIVEYRAAHGGFRSVEELREVDGIGEKRLAALRGAVRP